MPLYRCASWLGILYFLILAAILAWILCGLAKLFHFPSDQKRLIEILIGMAFAASLYGFINAAAIRINRINVQLPGLQFMEGQNRSLGKRYPLRSRKKSWVCSEDCGHGAGFTSGYYFRWGDLTMGRRWMMIT